METRSFLPLLFLVLAAQAGCACTESYLLGGSDTSVEWTVPDGSNPDVPRPDVSDPDVPGPDAPVDAILTDPWDVTDGALPGCAGLGADIVVPRDVASIQGAIDRASSGAFICVEPGIYREHLTIPGNGLHILGIAGPYFTIVDGDFWGTVATFGGDGSSTHLQGFTLRHGWGDFGGGVKVDRGSPTLSNVIVLDNLNFGFGGGVNVGSRGSPTFVNSIIQGNVTESGFGGGIMLERESRVTFQNVIIVGNETYSGFGGGGFLEGSAAELTNVIVAGNFNHSGYGGGLSISEGLGNSLTNVTFAGNDCVSGSGGGLHLGRESRLTMVNVDVSMNGPDHGCGGLHVDDPSAFITSYGNIWGNLPSDVGGISDPTGSDGNISADPGYLDISGELPWTWDVHLGRGSGLVDAGDPSLLDPDGSRSDIGAFGGPGAASWDIDMDGYASWWQPGPYDHATYPAMGLDCDDFNPLVYPGSGC